MVEGHIDSQRVSDSASFHMSGSIDTSAITIASFIIMLNFTCCRCRPKFAANDKLTTRHHMCVGVGALYENDNN